MYLFGLAGTLRLSLGLLSVNYYQTGIAQAVISYLTMLALILLNGASVLVDAIDEKIRCYIALSFYALLFIWYLAIIIDYFVTWG